MHVKNERRPADIPCRRAEALRHPAEALRHPAEAVRLQTEALRQQAEQMRHQAADAVRDQAGALRQQAETARHQAAEAVRDQTGALRRQASAVRQQAADAVWDQAEALRQQAGVVRQQTAEAVRDQAGALRQQAEQMRQQAADAVRGQAGALRQQAEVVLPARYPNTLLDRLGRLDRRAFDAVAAAHLPGLEYVLPRLSRVANHAVLWFGTAGALSLTRRARLRRAALRGVIAVGLASPVVNIVGKQAFRRKRPVIDLVPPVRIRWKLPTSHAFPSGHSASAAAFAAGVALEAPVAVAVPIAGLAAAVAFSRIYVGAHYPGDVLAGVGIGALTALSTRLVWPCRPPVAHVARTSTLPAGVTKDGHGVVAVVNPDAAGGEAVLGLLERELPAAEIVRFKGDGLHEVLDDAAARAQVLAVVGGDGTTNAGARAALRHDVPLLAIPGGTLDHFTRALGIETPGDALAAYRSGCVARIDVGTVAQPGSEADERGGLDGGEELPFLNTASFGAYAELVDRRERLEGRLGKWPAMAVAAVRTLRHSEPTELLVDGRPRRVWLAFVGNCAYGSRGPAPTWRERLDDGRLDIRLITTGRRVPRIRATAAILIGHLRITPGYRHWYSSTLQLTVPDGHLRIARDGETHSVAPVIEFRKRPAALSVFCPGRG